MSWDKWYFPSSLSFQNATMITECSTAAPEPSPRGVSSQQAQPAFYSSLGRFGRQTELQERWGNTISLLLIPAQQCRHLQLPL